MHPLSRRVLDHTPSGLQPGVRLATRVAELSARDRVHGLAAEIAFWALLSLPSLLLTVLAVAAASGDIGEADWQNQLVDRVDAVARVALTEETIENYVHPLLGQLLDPDGGAAIASFAFIAAVWTASRAVKVVLVTLSIAYGRVGLRPGWKDRLLGFGLTLGALLAGVILLPLLLAGPNFGEHLVGWLGQDPIGIERLWRIAYWPATIVVATAALAVLYHVGVPGRTPLLRDLPGAVLATTVWLAGSAGLRLYGAWITEGDSAYGPLAGPIVALLWIWVTALAVLLGAELNAAIEDVWPPDDDLEQAAGPAGEVTATRQMLDPPS